MKTLKKRLPIRSLGEVWSGKRDSNPRPLPWQGNALPAELFPRIILDKSTRSL